MLFNSYPFIFVFLPLLIGALFLLRTYTSYTWAHLFLVGVSISFYMFLDAQHIWVLLLSAFLNYGMSLYLAKNPKRFILVIGIAFNVLLLAGYKYLAFFASLCDIKFPAVEAPLGISFFTFHQLAYLIDIYWKRTQPTNVRDYALYVTFFPHLIAGPIMRYTQFAPQLAQYQPPNYTLGCFFFCVGLFKKVALADTFAIIADKAFLINQTQMLSPWEAWKGLLAYTWQIYFDFSSYSDMAIGLGLLCGIALPINFIAPYQATSISDFWRRWHISLSQFLRDYLYIPLGGNRFGYTRQVIALLVTMGLAGLWHGAAWTFVLWGFLHGVLLVIAHTYRLTMGKRYTVPSWMSWLLTFGTVIMLWVLFRVASLDEALKYYKALMSFASTPMVVTQEWVEIFLGACIVFVCKPLVSWAQYDATPRVLFQQKNVSFLYGMIAGLLFLMSLKAMSGEVSRSFVYFVF